MTVLDWIAGYLAVGCGVLLLTNLFLIYVKEGPETPTGGAICIILWPVLVVPVIITALGWVLTRSLRCIAALLGCRE